MKTVWTSILALLLLTASLLAATDSRRADRQLAKWQKKADAVKELLRSGDHAKAERKVNRILNDVKRSLNGGEGAPRLIGTLLALRAVGESGLGRHDHAHWSWQLANEFEPHLARVDLSEFGEAGKWVSAQNPDPERPEIDASQPGIVRGSNESELPSDSSSSAQLAEDSASPEDSQPVEDSRSAKPTAIRLAPGVVSRTTPSPSVFTEVVFTLDEAGRPSNPEIVAWPSNPADALGMIDLKRDDEFEPCLQGGEPVPCTTSMVLKRETYTIVTITTIESRPF